MIFEMRKKKLKFEMKKIAFYDLSIFEYIYLIFAIFIDFEFFLNYSTQRLNYWLFFVFFAIPF